MDVSAFSTSTIVVAAVFVGGCQFLEDNADVTKNVEIPVSFTIDGDTLCEESDANVDCQNPPNENAQMSYPLGEFEVDRDVDIVEASGRTELRDLAGRFKKITVSKIDYKFQNNTLTFTTPEISFDIGPKAVSSTDNDKTVQLTTIPPVDPGANPDATAEVSNEAENRASPYFKELEFSALPNGQPRVEEGDEIPPTGSADVESVIHVKFVANPVDAAN